MGRVTASAAALAVVVGGSVGVWAVGQARGPHEVVVAAPPLRFSLPHGWHAYHREQDPSAGWIKEAASSQGFTPQQYVDGIEASTLATEVGPRSGPRSQSVDVQRSAFTSLPTRDQVVSRLTGLGVQVDDVHSTHTEAGQVVVARGRLTLSDGPTTTEVVHLVTHGTVLSIPISAVGGGDVHVVTAGVLETLRTT